MERDAVPGARVVGRYAIFDPIASGGMATVHFGRFAGPGGFSRTVAVKRLHPQFASDPEFVGMFLEEARLAARIHHPNVVQTLDVVTSGDEVFIVMEYIEGETLARLLGRTRARNERMPIPALLRVGTDVLQGLHAAHEACDERRAPLNIVHRDVSPQNIMVGVDGVSRLLDFGVAKAAGRVQTTAEGKIKGKLAYMPPEQLGGARVTRLTDLYALAVVLWECATGQRLFTGENEAQLVGKLLHHEIEPPSRFGSLPETLEALIMKGLSREASQRFASAREMLLALEEVGPAASAVRVGEWVNELAANALSERSARVATVEATPAPDVGARSQVSSISVSSSRRQPTARPARTWMWLAGGGVGLVVTVAVVATTMHAAPQAVASPSVAVDPRPSAQPPAASVTQPAGQTSAPADSTAAAAPSASVEARPQPGPTRGGKPAARPATTTSPRAASTARPSGPPVSSDGLFERN
jgi:serine/threonine-protein kinase